MEHNRVYALYRNFETAATVANKLISGGFDSKHVSVITSDAEQKYAQYVDRTDASVEDISGDEGAGLGALVGALTGLTMALIPGFGPVLAAGPLGAMLVSGIGAATGAATGGLVASLIDFGLSEENATRYQDTLKSGGALVIVDLQNEGDETRIRSVLNEHDPIDVEYEAYP
jgi:uncharacterized membrane protein